MDLKNLFTGTWEVVSLHRKTSQGWMLYQIYSNKYGKNFIWDFRETRKQVSSSGSITYEGTVTEHWKWFEPAERPYAYYPNDHTLHIERSSYNADGSVSLYFKERYRMEAINETEYWLYDPEEVEKEPEDYKFRMKIRRLPGSWYGQP